MTGSPLGFIEFFVVLMFALGWLVLELVTRRLDKKREAGRQAPAAVAPPPEDDPSPRA